ncbi:hypothetical protein LB534_27325 [Mesorhizobium sp. CA18]|uniref:ATP-binding protein n=1 Tax=unclassified Mesorhizobium TaxID=325217 RepID=UPI001CCED3AA|nr:MULTISPECIES: ATP-binding protein [unclassified Mesorhizobium]MBZ9737132.1 hypothetical protein [Mesorhizobium sp. CA9]MBZ9829005.1 hypothetical protein [Mesorhizobium sp. CA18]MBZ9834677.1 hypothetical protein [Mesorhizobium sp. CA2]MBZ9840481.1 hypothetical protein [Mesorhizobium sp. CA3]MBZ9880494.1 hypothetical protein [Mesorhizobium sp. Ca11]
MRAQPKDFVGALGAQWLCAAMDTILGAKHLRDAPALMSGFGSVLDSATLKGFAEAATALRLLGVVAASEIQLRQLVYSALSWEEDHRHLPDYREPPYRIDASDPRFPFRRRVPDDDPELVAMMAAIKNPLAFRSWSLASADPTRSMIVEVGPSGSSERISVDLESFLPDAPPRFDFTREPRGAIEVPVSELILVAEELDEMDRRRPGRPPGNWAARMREANGALKVEMLSPDRATGRLVAKDTIRLDGLRHLIGLPGTGKTTLIVLLLMWLSARDYRVVVLLPSIETSLNLLGDLRNYGADVGLLMGQSPQTRIDHARKLADRIGATETKGFGATAEGAELLALNCALGGFEQDAQPEREFPHLSPPCTSVLQRSTKADGSLRPTETAHLCPLSAHCGRLRAPRELTDHNIWLGHVLSMDTRISPHFSDDRIRHFEAVAMNSDLVMVDEADGAQAVLDRKAVASLDLTGSESSYEHALNRDLFVPLSTGRTDVAAGSIQQYGRAASDFRSLNHSLVGHLQNLRLRSGVETPLSRFEDTFVTGNNILTAIFSPEDISILSGPQRESEERRFNAIRAFWDGCIRAALMRRTDEDQDVDGYGFDPERIAIDLGRSKGEVSATATAIAGLTRDWISEPLAAQRDQYLEQVRSEFFKLVEPGAHLGRDEVVELFRFLVGVTTVVMQFLALIPAQQAMVAEGVHKEPLFQQGISEDLGRLVPEALIGRLSGVRFRYEDEGLRSKVRLQYVSFRGAPRVLLYRLGRLLRHQGRARGPNVLLASATSYLAESPTFHIPVGPDIVLRRTGRDVGSRQSKYVFAPIPDTSNPSRMLRFSGSSTTEQDRVLKKMVEHYFLGEHPLAMQMVTDFDPGRKVGMVVNSYEQVMKVKAHIKRIRPDLAGRVIGVANRPPDQNDGDWISAAQVERLSARDNWDVLLFPMKALARGVNIVFESGPRVRDALLGTLVFLIRPHPASESLDLVAGIAGQQSLAFDMRHFRDEEGYEDLATAWRHARRELSSVTRRLLRFPLQASRLGELAIPFTADIMVDVLQTIGRAMRNGAAARAIFVDAAWAPRSAAGAQDNFRSSMLVAMRDILRNRIHDDDAVDAEIYGALYSPFYDPLCRCAGVAFSDGPLDE